MAGAERSPVETKSEPASQHAARLLGMKEMAAALPLPKKQDTIQQTSSVKENRGGLSFLEEKTSQAMVQGSVVRLLPGVLACPHPSLHIQLIRAWCWSKPMAALCRAAARELTDQPLKPVTH